MKTLRLVLSILVYCVFCSVTSVNAADIERGKRLHDEHCVKCHSSDMYTRENRIVNSYDALKERIRQCELSNDLAWFEEEVEDVSAYLDEEFYRFEEK